MSATVFVDTAYLIALLDVRDTRHREAAELAKKLSEKSAHLITTDAAGGAVNVAPALLPWHGPDP